MSSFDGSWSQSKQSGKSPEVKKILDIFHDGSQLRNRQNPTKGKYLSKLDKEIILQGTFHSQKKFYCVEVYVKKGKQYLEEYTDNLVREVRIHLAEEKSDYDGVEEDDNIMAFIRIKVTGIIRSQMVVTQLLQT